MHLSYLFKLYWQKTNLFHYAAILICTLIVYWPVYNYKFLIGWDDQWFVTNHYTENGFNASNILSIFSNFHYGQYAPVNQLYYTLLYYFFNYNPGFYHLAGLLIHLINTVLVYNLIKNIVTDISGHLPVVCKQTAFITAILFAVLPVNVEPVAWVAASKVPLYSLFYLLAMGCYRRYIVSSKQSFFYLALLLYIISFGAKEQAVFLPVCMLLFDYVYGRRLKDKMIWLEKIPFFILSVLFGIVSIQSQEIDDGGSFYAIYQRVPLVFYTISEYATKCILPVNLSYLYPFPFQQTEPVPAWMWLHTFAIPVIIYCLFKQITKKWALFGLLFFLVHILLVSNILSLSRFSVVADRYAYLSSIGLCFVIGYGFMYVIKKTKFPMVVGIIGIVYLSSLMVYARQHLGVWETAYTLKEKLKNTIEKRADYKEQKSKAN